MQLKTKQGMILFAKELIRTPRIYALYFAKVDTLSAGQTPRIHRFTVRSKKLFEQFELGGIYDFSAKKVRIIEFRRKAELQLPQQLYYSLMRYREERFGDIHKINRKRIKGEDIFPPEQCYSFTEAKNILAYNCAVSKKILVWIFQYILLALCILIPISLFFFVAYTAVQSGESAITRILNTVLLALGIMPMTVFLITFLFVISDTLLLKWRFTRFLILKEHVLAGASSRKSINISRSETNRLIIRACTAAAVLAVTILLCLILPPLLSIG